MLWMNEWLARRGRALILIEPLLHSVKYFLDSVNASLNAINMRKRIAHAPVKPLSQVLQFLFHVVFCVSHNRFNLQCS